MKTQPKTYFISDLHLTPERPAVIIAFFDFLEHGLDDAEKLYILGDLFEYWVGDDAANLLGARLILKRMQRVARNIPCFFIAGNRDFLVGEEFTRRSGFEILPDETLIDLYGTNTLVLHGDSLCTDDLAHQQFRQNMSTNREWQQEILALSIKERITGAINARATSKQHKSKISMEIMDVTEDAVTKAFKKNHVTQMIHGHTHRQNVHEYSIDQQQCKRYVLGDWAETSSVMTVSQNDIQIINTKIDKPRPSLVLWYFLIRNQSIKLLAFFNKT